MHLHKYNWTAARVECLSGVGRGYVSAVARQMLELWAAGAKQPGGRLAQGEVGLVGSVGLVGLWCRYGVAALELSSSPLPKWCWASMAPLSTCCMRARWRRWSKGEGSAPAGTTLAILYDRHAIIKTGSSQSSTKRQHDCGCGDHPPVYGAHPGLAVGAAIRAGALQLPARARPSSNP